MFWKKSDIKSEVSKNINLKLQEIFESSSDAVLFFDKKGFVTNVNKSFEEVTGVKNKEVIGKHAFSLMKKFLSKEDFPKIQQRLKKRLAGEQTGDYELKFRDKFLRVGSPIKGEDRFGYLATLRDVTEKKKAEENLKKEKEKAQQYLDLAGTMFIALDKQGNVTLANQKACEILGYTEKQIIGKNWFDNFVPKKVAKIIKPVSKKLLAGKVKPVEYFENPILTKKGEERLIAWHNSILKDKNENIIGHISSGEDITDKKKAAQVLEESEKKYKDIIQNVYDIIYSADINGVITFITPNISKYGYKSQEVVGHSISEFLHPDDLKPTMPILKSTLKTGKSTSAEFRVRKKDGSYEYVEENRNLVRDNGKIIGLIGSLRNIHEKAEITKELKKSEQKYINIINHISQMLYTHDTDHNMDYVSPQCKEIFGYTPEEMKVKWTTLTTNNPLNDIGFHNTQKALETGQKQKPYVLEIKRKDGELRFIEVNESPVKQNGKIIGMTGAITDVTEQKKAEKDLKESEAQSRMLFENAKDAIFWADAKTGILINCNKAAEYLLEKTRKEIIGQLQTSLHPPAKAKYYSEVFKKHIQQNGMLDEEAEVITKSGKIKQVAISANTSMVNNKLIIQGVFKDITEQKNAIQKLEESEERFNLAVNGSQDGIWDLNLITGESYVSPIFEHLLGFKTGQMKNPFETWQELLHPDDKQNTMQIFDNYLNKKIPEYNVEYRLKTKKEGYKWFNVRGSAIWEKNKPHRILGSIRDITDEKKAAENLKIKESAINSSINGIGITDLNGNLAYVNNSLVKMWRYDSAKQIIGRPLEEFWQGTKIKQTMQELLSKGRSEGEDIGVRKDGSLFTVRYSANVIKNEQGIPTQVFGSFVDISKQKRAIKDLADSEERYRDLFENANDLIQSVDANGKYTFVNKAWKNALGFSDDEINNLTFQDIISKEHLPYCNKIFKQLLKGKKFNRIETTFVAKDGKEIYVSGDLNAHFKDGKFISTRGIFRDITEEKHTSKALVESEKKFKTLFNSSRDAIMTLAPPSWKFTGGNPATVKMFGCKDEAQFTSLRPWEVSPEFQPDGKRSDVKAPEMIMKAMKEGSNFFEWTHKKFKGKNFQATVLLTKLELEKGKPFLQATVRDISTEKQAELALKQSEKNYKTIFDSASDAIFIHSLKDGTITDVNQRMLEMYGFQNKKEIIGKFVDIVSSNIAPYDADGAKEKVILAVQGKPQTFEWHAKRKDSSLFWVEVNLKRFQTSNEDKILAMVRDIDDRKKAEQEIQDRATQLEKFNKFATDRELRMVELKQEVEELKKELER